MIAAETPLETRALDELVREAIAFLDRRRVRVSCAACGEGINYQREVQVAGRTLCRPCAGGAYYLPRPELREAVP